MPRADLTDAFQMAALGAVLRALFSMPDPRERERVGGLVRQFVTGPGRAEVDLERRLCALGLRVEMWPGFDAYDLPFPKRVHQILEAGSGADPFHRHPTKLHAQDFEDGIFLVVGGGKADMASFAGYRQGETAMTDQARRAKTSAGAHDRQWLSCHTRLVGPQSEKLTFRHAWCSKC